MTAKHLTLVAVAAAVAVAVAAAPAAADDWFGISVSNNGLSLGFGSSSWGLWASSWDRDPWDGGFDAALSGYGEWVWVSGLGRVWRPWVEVGWQPFSYGRWVWTSLGWTWVAYEPWGWLPHHYGQWAMTTVGWVWTPGYTYSPGNVVWVTSGRYVGWYPCAPHGWSHFDRGFDRGWTAGYRHGSRDGYQDGYADGWRDARYATWVPWSDIDTDNVSHHVVRSDVAVHSMPRADVTALSAPPSRVEVERRSGRSVPEARLVERTATVDGHQLKVVRPEGQETQVRRYGTETVERALAPTARTRVDSESGRSRTGAATSTRTVGPSSPTLGRSEPGRTERSAPATADRGESANRFVASPAGRTAAPSRTTATEPTRGQGSIVDTPSPRRWSPSTSTAVVRRSTSTATAERSERTAATAAAPPAGSTPERERAATQRQAPAQPKPRAEASPTAAPAERRQSVPRREQASSAGDSGRSQPRKRTEATRAQEPTSKRSRG